MNVYNPKIIFSSFIESLESKIKLNSECNIIFINHGKSFKSFASATNGTIYEIIIESKSREKAIEAIDLLNSCISIFYGASPLELYNLINNINTDSKKQICSQGYVFLGDDGAYIAAQMACEAEKDKSLRAATLKFNVSQSIFYLHPKDLEPFFNDNYKYVYLMSEQFKMGYAILADYSILENLGLQVKSNEKNPSIINKTWNPVVIKDLETRLKNMGLDPNEEIPWLSRNVKERPFKKQVFKGALCDWSDGIEIMDFLIRIKEAILEVSYIRSVIAAHANLEKIQDLCLYDVENANGLIRNVLLNLLKKR